MKFKMLFTIRFKDYSALLLLLVLSGSMSLGQCFKPLQQLNPSGINRNSIVSGDFNNDNAVDFVTANTSSNSISFFRGNGSGSFVAPVQSTVSSPSFVISADLDNDNFLDLVMVSSTGNAFFVALNSKLITNPFNTVNTYGLAPGTTPTTIAVGDFNLDGKKDLAITNSGNNTVSILLGAGNGTFTTSSLSTNTSGLSQPWGIASADFNSDSNPDLLVTMNSGNRALLFFGNGTGIFGTAQTPSSPPKVITLGLSGNPRAITVANFNNDAYPDIALVNFSSNNISVLTYNNVNATFNSATNYTIGNGPTGIVSGNFDEDGFIDLAISNSNSGFVSLLTGKGDGTFNGSPINLSSTQNAQPQAIVAANFDGDSKLDLATSNSNAALGSARGIDFFYAQQTPNPSVSKLNCSITLTIAQQGVGDVYSLNGGSFQSSNNFVNIQPGTYTIATKNTTGCTTVNANYTITPLVTPVIRDVAVLQPTCDTRAATITIIPDDNENPLTFYSYSINNGANYLSGNIFSWNLNENDPGLITTKILSDEGCVSEAKSKRIKDFKPDLQLNVANESVCDNSSSNIQLSDNNQLDTDYLSYTTTSVLDNVTISSSQGNSTLINDVLTLINGGASGSITYTIVASSGNDDACKSIKTQIINVKSRPIISVPTSDNNFICSGASTYIVVNTAATGTLVDWLVASNSVSGASNQTNVGFDNGSLTIAQVLSNTNSDNSFGNVAYTITPKFIYTDNNLTCYGDALQKIISVEPVPKISIPSTSIICSGNQTNITISNSMNSTAVSWSILASDGISGASNSDGTISLADGMYTISQALINSISSTGTVTYFITPILKDSDHGNLVCSGASQNALVTIYPVPTLTLQGNSSTICSGFPTNIVVNCQSPGALVDWSTDSSFPGGSNVGFDINGNLTIAQALTNNNNTPLDIVYSITPKFTNINGLTCLGQDPLTVKVTVNPIPSITVINAANTICSGIATNLSITNANQVTGALVDWTITPSSFLGASARNDVSFNSDGVITVSQLLVNLGNSTSSVNYIFTPKFTNNGVTCAGQPSSSLQVTVNPKPSIRVDNAAQTICSNTATNILITNTNQVSGTLVDWTISPSSFSGASAKSNNGFSDGNTLKIAQTLTNSGNSASSITYKITPKFTNNSLTCPGADTTITVTVNALPAKLIFNSTFSSCSGATLNMAAENLNYTYSWSKAFFSNNITGFREPASGSQFSETLSLGDIPTTTNVREDTLTGTVVYGVSAVSTVTGCASEAAYAIATIVPKPSFTITNYAPILCSGDRTNMIFNAKFNSSQLLLSSVDYSGIDGGGIQAGKSRFVNGQLLNQLLRNLNSNSEQTVTYTFTPLYGTCVGDAITEKVKVKPLPAGTFTTDFDVVCNGASQKISYKAASTGTVAYLQKLNLNGLTRSNPMLKEGDMLIDEKAYIELLNNPNATDLIAQYTISQRNGACVGDPIEKEVRVLGKDTKLSLSFTETNLCKDDMTTFKPSIDLQGSGTINFVEWKYGDNLSEKSPINNPARIVTHQYAKPGTYSVSLEVKTTSECSGTFGKLIKVSPLITVGAEGFTDGFSTESDWTPQSFNEITNSYQLIDPDKTSWLRGVASGTTIKTANDPVWWTGKNYIDNKNTYGANEKSAIYSPCFKIDTTIVKRPMLSLDAIVDLQNNVDGVVLQYSTNGNDWTNVGNVGAGINWFNGSGITSNPGNQEVGNYGWTGNSNPKWKSSRFNLYQTLNDKKRNIIQFRFAFSSDATNPPSVSGSTFDGFAFDNFFIGGKSRTVLVEQFINYTNEESKTVKSTINQLYDGQTNIATDFNPISYHIGFPASNGASDTLNIANPDDPAARSAFYGITTPPKTDINGLIQSSINYSSAQFAIDTASLSDLTFDLQLTTPVATSSTQLSMDLIITSKRNNNFTKPLLAYVALVQNKVVDPFRKIVRKQLLGGDGKLISQNWAKGQSITISLKNVEINVPIYNPKDLSLVAFIQDKITKEIYQSISVPAPEVHFSKKIIAGMELSMAAADVSIFPNPAQGQFSVSCPQGSRNWCLINQLGVEVLSGVLEQPINEKYTVNASGIAAGVYYFKLSTEGGKSVVKKLVLLSN